MSHMGFGDHWTGLNDAEVDDVWRWQDGTLVGAYQPWGVTEPNGSIFENCVELGPTGFWNDMACTASRRFVCEK